MRWDRATSANSTAAAPSAPRGRPLARLQQYADAVTRGERTALPVLGNNEVGQVGQAMESMRRALDGKTYVTEYVQALTHELKGPIAAISGASELLQETMPPADRQRFLGNIHNETARMQELVERLLDLASLEYRPSLELADPVDLSEVVEDVCDSLQPLIQAKGLALDKNVQDGLTVHGDYFLLARAVGNLLKNAIEFSAEGGRIVIGLQLEENRISLSVTDEGPGIPVYARERVFDRFFSTARPDGRKGSGLGLSFVREIASLHKAEVLLHTATADELSDSIKSTGTRVQIQFRPVERFQP